MGFKLEGRTQEWFDLAIERELHKTISSEDAGGELRAVAREERPNRGAESLGAARLNGGGEFKSGQAGTRTMTRLRD